MKINTKTCKTWLTHTNTTSLIKPCTLVILNLSCIDVGELERLGGLDHKMPWKSVFALIKDTEMRLHNSLLSVPLGCLWMQKWWSGRGRLLSTTKWPSLGRIQIYFTLQLSPFYTYLNLDMPCSDEFCPGEILLGGYRPPLPPSIMSMIMMLMLIDEAQNFIFCSSLKIVIKIMWGAFIM